MLAHSAKQITWLTTNFNFVGMHAAENIGIKLSTERGTSFIISLQKQVTCKLNLQIQ